MSDVPKIVHDRLRASLPGGVHPDADVLTAFAEQVLSGSEREDVVRHLAHCGDCREVIALSIPPIETVTLPVGATAEPVRERRYAASTRSWFAWPNMRWAAMAAAVVVVASVLMLRPEQKKLPAMEVGTEEAAYKNLAGRADARPAERSENQFAQPASAPPPATLDKGVPSKSLAAKTAEPLNGRTQNPVVGGPITRLEDNKRADAESKNGEFFEADRVRQAPVRAVGKAAEGVPSETVEVTSEQAVVSTDAAGVAPSAAAEGRLSARNAAPTPTPVEKAKLAEQTEKAAPAEKKEDGQVKSQLGRDESAGKLAAAFPAQDQAFVLQKQRLKQSKDIAAQWSLAQGKLQRSLDAGSTWQVVLELQHPLLAFGARGSEIWAGGQGGSLFHSSDSGATWSMVQPSTKGASLKADIVAIEIRSAAEIVLATRDDESWTTLDAGKTWEKK